LQELPKAHDRAMALCRLMVGPQFRGQWAAVVRTSLGPVEEPPQLLHAASGRLSTREPYLSRGVLRKVRETGEPVLASNAGFPAGQDGNIDMSISPDAGSMAAVACQIGKTEQTMDVLYVMLPPALGSAEWLALVSMAVKQFQQAEASWASRKQAASIAVIEKELERARHIQMRLVPSDPRFDGLDVAIGFLPCHFVGGDYVDATTMADGRTLLAIADVCGKGLPAALVASSVHTMIHAGVLSRLGLRELVTNLNRYLNRILHGESFVTMIALAVNSARGEVEMVNAGHPPVLLVSPGTDPARIEMEGNLPLGMSLDPILAHEFAIEPEQMLAIYSDGLTELRKDGGDLLGIGGLSEILRTAYCTPETSARQAAAELSLKLDTIRGAQPDGDDRTFLLARRPRGPVNERRPDRL